MDQPHRMDVPEESQADAIDPRLATGPEFAELFVQMSNGASDVRPAKLYSDEWEDLLQEFGLMAWDKYAEDPGALKLDTIRHLASKVIRLRAIDRGRADERRLLRDGDYLRNELGDREEEEPSALDRLIDEERKRAIHHALRSLDPLRRAVAILMGFYDRGRRETAAELQVSERRVRRAWETARALLAVALADWRPPDPAGSYSSKPTEYPTNSKRGSDA